MATGDADTLAANSDGTAADAFDADGASVLPGM